MTFSICHVGAATGSESVEVLRQVEDAFECQMRQSLQCVDVF